MFIYNVHAPTKTFALPYKEKESCTQLLDRIIAKADLSQNDADTIRSHHDGSGVTYEFEGERWSLEDDDDLSIALARFNASDVPLPGITLHIVLPFKNGYGIHSDATQTPHTHFRVTSPNSSYPTASSRLQERTVAKSKTRSGSVMGSVASGPTQRRPSSRAGSYAGYQAGSVMELTDGNTPFARSDPLTATNSLAIPNTDKYRTRSIKSARSTRSRKSKWGDDNAEPLGEVKKRQFNEFQANNGVRTVVGKVGPVANVRMLLKPGYRHVYISRAFAARHGLTQAQPGVGGYTGLQILGAVPITVGSRTAYHQVMLSEEQHFDVVLGRQWLERMNVKVDPMDQTLLTYMDTGEPIACDLVVLRDANGEIITIT